METVRIFPLHGVSRTDRQRLREAQQEAARVWMFCVDQHRMARQAHQPWPGRHHLQEATKGGQYALHSQSVQMVVHQFLANVDTIAKLRQTNPKYRYPYHPKKYLTVEWPAQAVSRKGNTLLLPMGRGRKSLTLHLRGLPRQIGAVSLVWNGGYALHLVVPVPDTPAPSLPEVPAQAAVDLGEIHLAAVTTNTGKAFVVTGRGIRSAKRRYNMTLGQVQRLQSRCKKGSKRWRRLQYTKERAKGDTQRQVRDQRHKATRQVVDFCQQEGVQTVYVGNPDGVRRKDAGRHHNQRIARWEYGKDINYLHEKSEQAHLTCFTGSERGTSSTCPSCGKRKKPTGRNWTCRHCGFHGHRDIVGSMNMHPIAFGSRVSYPTSLTYRRPGPVRVRQRNEDPRPIARTGTS